MRCPHLEPVNLAECNPHLRHPPVTLPHLRDLDEEFPCWWRMTQTPINSPQRVQVADTVESATGSGWQFLSDWTPRDRDIHFHQVLESIKARGFDPEFDGSPIELIKFRSKYWVADGHRRVSTARYSGLDMSGQKSRYWSPSRPQPSRA